MQNKIDETLRSDFFKKVWIGDPCYVISDELWDSVVGQIYQDGHTEIGFVIRFSREQLREAHYPADVLEGLKKMDDSALSFIQCGTAYGDGLFPSASGFKYGVDAGRLAIVPDYLICPEKRQDAEKLGKFFEVGGAISLKTDGRGLFRGAFQFGDRSRVFEIVWTGDEDGDGDDF